MRRTRCSSWPPVSFTLRSRWTRGTTGRCSCGQVRLRAKSLSFPFDTLDVQIAMQPVLAPLAVGFCLTQFTDMLSEQSRFKEGKDVCNLLILACTKYQKAHNIDPNNFELLYNWG